MKVSNTNRFDPTRPISTSYQKIIGFDTQPTCPIRMKFTYHARVTRGYRCAYTHKQEAFHLSNNNKHITAQC
ncbi:hypothetical protein Hanom_Chr09g00804291 [Helianthus anomalus]